MRKKLVKALAALLLLWLSVLLSDAAGQAACGALERGSPLLYRYASAGDFSGNPYFSAETEAAFGIPGRLFAVLGAKPPEELTEAARLLSSFRLELVPALAENRPYLEYLRENGTSLSELFSFCEAIAELPANVTAACRYLCFLLWVLALHLLMRCRPALYALMGGLCVLATLFRLSGRLAAAGIFQAPALYDLFAADLLPALLEAMLTFLIFDITLAAFEKTRLSKRLSALYDDLPELSRLTAALALLPDSGAPYRSDVSRLLPRFTAYARTAGRSRKKAARLAEAVRTLSGPHTNRGFHRDLVALQTLLPPR